jgi:hypothetical protein
MANSSVYLFCEGGSGSLDMQVLKKIPFDGKSVTVQPFGGKGGHGRFVEGFEQGASVFIKSLGTTPDSHFIVFRDRDFDFEMPETPRLIPAGRNVFAGYRATIENYLLHPDTLLQFCQSKNINAGFADVEAVSNIFDQAAREIAIFQAARHTLGKIRSKAEQKTNFIARSQAVQPDRANHAVQFLSSGQIPEHLDEAFCIAESHRVIAQFQIGAGQFSEENFDQVFPEFKARFSRPDFFIQTEYLVFFQGKDFAKALSRLLPSQFPLKQYYQFAVEHFDYRQFPDLAALRETIIRL